MTLKKINALCSLFLTASLLLHLGMSDFSLMTGWYHEQLSLTLARIVAGIIAVHIIISLIIFFFFTDDKFSNKYHRLNAQVILQRISGLLMLLFFSFHIPAFNLFMKGNFPSLSITILLTIAVILFYSTICTHLAVSFSHSFLSLGLLRSEAVEKKINLTAGLVSLFLFLISVYALIRAVIH